ncbi:phage tail protein [Gallibacterium anatis]|uniref:phage tail protein n=2 Tax=Gallibacterium anatis TaxID=750 RepID=UPI0030074902
MAGLKEQNKWENEIYRIEENDPVVGGEDGISNKPQKQLANRTQWLKAKIAELFGKGTPKKISGDTTNTAEADGHTHEIEKASTSRYGITQLTDSINFASSLFAASALAVKTAYDKAVSAYNLAAGKANSTTNISAGNGLTGGGQINANRTIAMGTPSSITASTTNSVTSTSHTHAIEKGSLTTSGIVQLTDSVNQDSSVFAATAKAVKTAFDKAVGAYNAAAGKVSKAGDTMTGVLRAADFVMNRNGNQKLSSLFDALIKLAQGDATGFQNIVNTWGNAGTTPLGITYNFTNPNAWYICFGPFFGNLIIQGGYFDSGNDRIRIINYPIRFNLDIPVRVVTPHMADNSHKPTPVIITGYDRAVVNQSQELHIKVYNNSLISGIGCFWIAFGC